MAEQCIPSNPDITGIGVRTAIYAQNLLCFAPVVVHLWDGIVTDEELRGIREQTFGMLAIAFAILISTIIGAKSPGGQTQAVTGFHAAIILELSWMNNTSTWVWCLLFVHYQSKPQPTQSSAAGDKLRALLEAQLCNLLQAQLRDERDLLLGRLRAVQLRSELHHEHHELRQLLVRRRDKQLQKQLNEQINEQLKEQLKEVMQHLSNHVDEEEWLEEVARQERLKEENRLEQEKRNERLKEQLLSHFNEEQRAKLLEEMEHNERLEEKRLEEEERNKRLEEEERKERLEEQKRNEQLEEERDKLHEEVLFNELRNRLRDLEGNQRGNQSDDRLDRLYLQRYLQHCLHWQLQQHDRDNRQLDNPLRHQHIPDLLDNPEGVRRLQRDRDNHRLDNLLRHRRIGDRLDNPEGVLRLQRDLQLRNGLGDQIDDQIDDQLDDPDLKSRLQHRLQHIRRLDQLLHPNKREDCDLLGLSRQPSASPVDATFGAWFSEVQVIWQKEAVGNFFKRMWHLMARAPVLAVGSIHLSLMAAVGLWLWSDPFRFGESIPCDPSLTVVGGGVDLSSTPLRIFSLMMYSLLAIPGVNLLLPFSFFLALHVAYNAFRRRHHDKKTIYADFIIVGLVSLVIINIILLVDIELTLVRNKQSLSLGDNEWGFGQILALLLLVIPVRDFITSWMAINRRMRKQQEVGTEEVRHMKDRLQQVVNE